MFSLRFLRFLLFPILSVAFTTGSLLMLCSASAHAQGGVPLWTNRYDGPANENDDARAIAVDSNGNVFVTGYSWNGSNADYATIKYSNEGVPLWTNYYDVPANSDDDATAIALDSSGNVFVTGYSDSFGSGSPDYATVAYSNAGVPLWTNRYDGPGNDYDHANAIAVDRSGNVFVTGASVRVSGAEASSQDYVTVAYSNAGVPLWTNFYNGPADSFDSAEAIAVDSNGNVFVTGDSTGMVTGGFEDYATIAYSNAGVPLWTNRYDEGHGIAIVVDSSGNVFVAGTGPTIAYSSAGVPLWTNRYSGNGFNGIIAVDSSGNVFVTGFVTASGGTDYATTKYSNAGVPLWTRRYSGPGNREDYAAAIAVDSNGNVFVTGDSTGMGTGEDYATIAYSNAGVPLWTNRYDGPANGEDLAYAIAVDSNGNVFVTGSSWNGTNYDSVTIKYSSSIPPPRLDFQLLSNQLVLTWTNVGFNLQSAPAIPGTFSNISGATSPYTNPLTAPQQYFRLKGDGP